MQLETKAPCTLVYVCLALIFFQSCVSQRDMIALNGADPAIERGTNSTVRQQQLMPPASFKIQSADILIINLNAFEGNTSAYLQQEFASRNLNNGGQREFGPAATYYNGYQVDNQGYIHLPMLDPLKVEGHTTDELKIMLDSSYAPYLKFASTTVKLANMRVTILGEVKSPGVQYFYNTQTTLLEAISLAGDFTDFGNRQKVKLIRRNGTSSETVILDLNRPGFIDSPYYFIQPNDVIYIEPIKPKGFDVSSRSVGIVLSAISTGVLLANIFLNNR